MKASEAFELSKQSSRNSEQHREIMDKLYSDIREIASDPNLPNYVYVYSLTTPQYEELVENGYEVTKVRNIQSEFLHRSYYIKISWDNTEND